MDNNDDPATPELANATKDIAENVAIATIHPQQPSIIFSSKGDSYSSPLHKLQHHISKVLKGLSPSEEVKTRVYNPEILTTQKRQWASFQQSLDHKLVKEPSQLFESIVVVGLHHNVDLQAFKRQLVESDIVGPKKLSNILNHQLDNVAGVNIEPQVLFVYPADKELPLPYKDLVSICLPGGVEVHAIERTPSLSELNEIFLGQERLKKSDLSFVFRLQVADNSTLYGCCVLVEEIVQNPSRLVSILSEKKCLRPFLSRHIITTTRCYCILSRLPFFSLHFGVLKSIFAEERLERLTSSVDILNFFSPEENNMQEESQIVLSNHSTAKAEVVEEACDEPILIPVSLDSNESNKCIEELDSEDVIKYNKKSQFDVENGESFTENKLYNEMQKGHVVEDEMDMESNESKRAAAEAVLPLGQSHQYESFDHFGRKMRINVDDPETEGPFYHQEDSNSHIDILQWAKEKNHGSLQIICEYYRLQCPARGSKLTFQPLEHLHPLEFYRAHCAHLAEEEVMALSVWTIACVCATLRLENILTMFAAALLEKQIVVVSSNLGILSASVLSAIPLIRPYQWQSLLMPVLPNDMLDFLDAPVPYIVGIKEISAEVQLKITNSVIVDANRNTVRSPLMPQLPQYKELLTSLNPYYTKLVGESYLARKRPVYECTDVQVEAAGGFLAVLGSYLDSLCSNLRAHTITNVQSNRDKVSLLLKESFIDSFPNRDRPFIKLFVDTQLFSVHTDFILSLYQKD